MDWILANENGAELTWQWTRGVPSVERLVFSVHGCDNVLSAQLLSRDTQRHVRDSLLDKDIYHVSCTH